MAAAFMDLAVIASTVVQIVYPVILQIQVVLVLPRSQLVILVTQERTEWVAKATAQPVSMVVEKGKRKTTTCCTSKEHFRVPASQTMQFENRQRGWIITSNA